MQEKIKKQPIIRVPKHENRLDIKFPDVAKLWHPTLNGNTKASDISYGSRFRAYFQCSNGHTYEAAINNLTSGGLNKFYGCRKCYDESFVTMENRFDIRFPEISKEWHPTLNTDKTPDMFSYGTHYEAYFLCPNDHIYKSRVSHRTIDGQGCSRCWFLTDENKISVKFPEIAKIWHPTLNGDLTPDKISYGSNKEIYLLCPQGHTFKTTPNTRTSNISRDTLLDTLSTGCPECPIIRVNNNNRLSTLYPDIAKELHPTLNDFTADEVSYGSNKIGYFICENNHIYQAMIVKRTTDNVGCSLCVNKTEQKIRVFLKENNYVLSDTLRFDWCKSPDTNAHYPFDIVVEMDDQRIVIIECDGIHHFKPVGYCKGLTVDQVQFRDVYKTKCANLQGISVIRIAQEDVWDNLYDWKKDILEALQVVCSQNFVQNFFLCRKNEYDKHKEMLHQEK